MAAFHDFVPNDLHGRPAPLSAYADQVLLVVNTASRCGFAPQLEGLQKLHADFRDRGFAVLGFPSNDFLGQEPLAGVGIEEFCRVRYAADFPLFEKIHVRGKEMHPVYRYLTEEGPKETRGAIKWNFTKFLVGRDGRILARYAPNADPASLRKAIEPFL